MSGGAIPSLFFVKPGNYSWVAMKRISSEAFPLSSCCRVCSVR